MDFYLKSKIGFKLNRCCTDNIFILKSIIDFQLIIKKELFFGIFIDYKKAFDTVPHNKMFQKLDHMGVYGKFIRTVAKIYHHATVTINVNNDFTEKINVTKGVLQGDPLSPLLYALYNRPL